MWRCVEEGSRRAASQVLGSLLGMCEPDHMVAPGKPAASSETVRARMSKQRRRDTQPEVRVRRILHARGIRFRIDVRPEPDLRCKADILWRSLRLAVFVDGCFWHGCPDHATRPKANAEWWAHKLDGNRLRDRRTDSELAARGWMVLRFWEHEDSVAVADAICSHLEQRRRPLL